MAMGTDVITSVARELELANEKIKALTITSDVEYTEAGEFLRRLKATAKELDKSELAQLKRQLYQDYKEADEQLKFWEKAIEKASRQIRDKMTAYTVEKEAEAKRAAEEAAQRMADATGDAGYLENVAPAQAAPDVAGVHYATVWDFEVTDPGKVPDQYKTIDTVAIRKVVRAQKGNTQIPGVRVFSKQQVRVR